MGIKKMYYYFFYKMYKFWEQISIPKFWSDTKATLSIDVLEIFLCLSIVTYYTVFTNHWLSFENEKFLIAGHLIFIAVPNYFTFQYKGRWKQIVSEFDELSEEKNDRGSLIVLAVTSLIIINLIFSFYLMSKMNQL